MSFRAIISIARQGEFKGFICEPLFDSYLRTVMNEKLETTWKDFVVSFMAPYFPFMQISVS
jgi:hypothetical protein